MSTMEPVPTTPTGNRRHNAFHTSAGRAQDVQACPGNRLKAENGGSIDGTAELACASTCPSPTRASWPLAEAVQLCPADWYRAGTEEG